jgi:hypothetical protein
VAKGYSGGGRRLLKWKGLGVLLELNSIGNKSIRYFDLEWLPPFLLSLVDIIKEGDNDNC